jgi:hypothetical protein
MGIVNKKVIALVIVGMIAAGAVYYVLVELAKSEYHEISIQDVLGYTSTRNSIEDVVITSDQDPLLSLVATPAACWYNIAGTEDQASRSDSYMSRHGLKPFFIGANGELNTIQYRTIDYLEYKSSMVLGSMKSTDTKETFRAKGPLSQVSLMVAEHVYASSAGALIIENNQKGYELGTVAAPIASYLNIPIIIIDPFTSYSTITSKLDDLYVKYVIIASENANKIAGKLGFDAILLETPCEINDNVLQVIKNRFGEINYITMTNPADILTMNKESVDEQVIQAEVNNLKVQTGRTESDIIGESEHTFDITVPDGINRIQIYINFTSIESTTLDPLKSSIEIEPYIFGYLYDSNNELSAFAPSFSYDVGKDYLETQVYNVPGNYKLVVDVYYGTKGFSTYAGTTFGISSINAKYDVRVITTTQTTPHLAWYPKMSMMAGYLTASHGGLVLGDPFFELTTEDYAVEAEGYSTGPYYTTGLHPAVNSRVAYVVESLNHTIESLLKYDLGDGYLNGPAWLAVLAGPNMIPQYYETKEASWVEDSIYGVGWPTDNKYNFDHTVSNSRVLGRDVGDISALIARTLFYEPYVEGHSKIIKEQYGNTEEWKNNFHFLAGEAGGRTGWFFWQREFAPEVEQHGFESEEYYQNYENDRQTMIYWGAYERANYFDLMMHGNWYWYVPELNGPDTYSTSVKNSDLIKAPEDWELGPSIYNSGSCILGRIDGISPVQSLTFAFVHAGINAFFSSTRSTGSEAKAGTIERGLLYDDISVGEALRQDKIENQEPAAYYVRMLYADPAFNPYEPENGFSNQGRPNLIDSGGNENENGETEETSIGTRSGYGVTLPDIENERMISG